MIKFDRRFILKLGIMASLSTLLSGCDSSTQSVSTTEKVLVIGAGIAGLSAARMLAEAGVDITIIEGRDRIGGRVWTSRVWPDAPMDMGASWIHGVRGNPITEIADQIGVERLLTDYENMLLYDETGTLLSDAESEGLYLLGEEMLSKAIAFAEQSSGKGDAFRDISMQEALAAVIPVNSSPEFIQQLDFYVNNVIEQELAADISELSARNSDDTGEFGGEDVLFPNGYGQITEFLAEGLDIKLDHLVQKVELTGEQVTIITDQGNFVADRLIVTLPLAILKAGQVEFSPPLPSKKQAAIESLGMGILNKTYLRFPTAFWPQELDGFSHLAEQKGEWSTFFSIYHYTGKPILLGFNAGAFGRAIEKLSDEEIVAEMMAVLRKIYGDEIPEPEAWQITRWGSDPFALGSYSFNSVGASREERQALATPIKNRLFFAGEATSTDYPATVHGAYLSGQREAERVLDLL